MDSVYFEEGVVRLSGCHKGGGMSGFDGLYRQRRKKQQETG